MKKSFLFFLFLGIFFIASSFNNKVNAITCTYQTGTVARSFIGTSGTSEIQACSNALSNGLAACGSSGGCVQGSSLGSCSTDPKTGVKTCSCSIICRTCPAYTSYSCPSSYCDGTTLYSGVSCSGNPSLPCHYSTVTPNSSSCTGGGTCTAGIGTTNASCGGNQTACQCNGTTCQTQGYYCSANSCVLG